MKGVLPLLFLVLGCGPDLPPVTKIDSLRVLAIRAEPPEVAAGGLVTLTALVVDPKLRDVSYTWTACVVPERGTGFFASGAGGSGASGGGGYGISDAGSCTAGAGPVLKLGNAPAATLLVPSDFLDDPATIARAYGFPEGTALPPPVTAFLLGTAGVNLTVALVVTAGDERIESFKRVNVSLSADKNQNPTDLAFHLAPKSTDTVAPRTGTPPPGGRCILGEDVLPAAVGAGEFTLTAVNVPDPPVTYDVIVGGESGKALAVVKTEETLFYSFFSTLGSFDEAIVKSTGGGSEVWSLDAGVTGPVPLWVVVRDGRGGTSWCHSELTVPLVGGQ